MEKLVESIEENFKFFQQRLQYCNDVEFRILHPHNIEGNDLIIMYCENVIDESLVYESLFEKSLNIIPIKTQKLTNLF